MNVHLEFRAAGDMDLAAVGALLAEPARARALLALADGRSLSASVLALEAGVAPSTASHHLAKLVEAGLVTATRRGRYRYFTLSGPRVGELIEAAARVAPLQPITSLRQGTHAHAVRYARTCYDHLAGRLGIALTDALCAHALLVESSSSAGTHINNDREVVGFAVTSEGAEVFSELGIPAFTGEAVRGCLDWTEQRHHIAGPLGRATLKRMIELGWLVRYPRSRALQLTDIGRSNLPGRMGVKLPAD